MKKAEKSPYTRPFRILGWGTILFFVGVLLFSIYQPADLSDRVNHAVGWIAMFIAAVALIGALVLGGKEGKRKAKQAIRVKLLDGAIVREDQEGSSVTIPLGDIRAAREGHGWLLVEGSDPPKRIGVPVESAGFIQIRQEVAARCEIKPLKIRLSPQAMLLLGLLIAGFVFLLIGRTKVIVVSAAFGVLAIYGVSVYSARRVVLRKGKKWILMFGYVLFFLSVLLVVFFRFRSLR